MSITHQPSRRDLRVEGQFLPDDLGDLIDLRERVIEVIEAGEVEGVPPRSATSTANSLIGWLVAKSAGATGTKSPNAQSGYRKILEALDARDPQDGQRQAGRARLSLVAALATASVAAASPSAASLLASPIIYEPPKRGYVELAELELAAVA